jgi:cobalt-precorrin-5B (C1)-methyltransferase
MKELLKQSRTGVTTGLCAAAAAKAAAITLLSSEAVRHVTVTAKTGTSVTFEVAESLLEKTVAQCAVQKDSGDDPDITNGIKVFAAVSKTDTNGIEIDGGDGVGRVTKPGLKVAVGKAAINPVPMEMVNLAIAEACSLFSYTGGIKAVISIPGGEAIAKKTMNKRLGIVGGLSILGTTGIVEPMSDRAIIETIKAEMDVQAAAGKADLLAAPGNYGCEFAEKSLGINIEEAIKCSNFIGEMLDYASIKGIKKITLIGHAGKLVKIAGGVMNTHSSIADCRMEIIAAHCALAGAGPETIRQIMACVTVEAAIATMENAGVNNAVWESIGQKIGFHLRERTRGAVAVEYIVFTQEHGVLIHSNTEKQDSNGNT